MNWFFTDILANLTLVFRADWQQIGQLLSNRLNYWMLFYIMFMYYGYLFMMLYQMYDVLTVLLENTGIVFTFPMGTLILAIIVLQEDKLSIIRETARAFTLTPLIYLLSMWKRGFYMMWTNVIVPSFSSLATDFELTFARFALD